MANDTRTRAVFEADASDMSAAIRDLSDQASRAVADVTERLSEFTSGLETTTTSARRIRDELKELGKGWESLTTSIRDVVLSTLSASGILGEAGSTLSDLGDTIRDADSEAGKFVRQGLSAIAQGAGVVAKTVLVVVEVVKTLATALRAAGAQIRAWWADVQYVWDRRNLGAIRENIAQLQQQERNLERWGQDASAARLGRVRAELEMQRDQIVKSTDDLRRQSVEYQNTADTLGDSLVGSITNMVSNIRNGFDEIDSLVAAFDDALNGDAADLGGGRRGSSRAAEERLRRLQELAEEATEKISALFAAVAGEEEIAKFNESASQYKIARQNFRELLDDATAFADGLWDELVPAMTAARQHVEAVALKLKVTTREAEQQTSTTLVRLSETWGDGLAGILTQTQSWMSVLAQQFDALGQYISTILAETIGGPGGTFLGGLFGGLVGAIGALFSGDVAGRGPTRAPSTLATATARRQDEAGRNATINVYLYGGVYARDDTVRAVSVNVEEGIRRGYIQAGRL